MGRRKVIYRRIVEKQIPFNLQKYVSFSLYQKVLVVKHSFFIHNSIQAERIYEDLELRLQND